MSLHFIGFLIVCKYSAVASRLLSEFGFDERRQWRDVQQNVENHGGEGKHEAGDEIDLCVGHGSWIPFVDVRVSVGVSADKRFGRRYGTILSGALRQSQVLSATVERLRRQVGAHVPCLCGVCDPRQPFGHATVRPANN